MVGMRLKGSRDDMGALLLIYSRDRVLVIAEYDGISFERIWSVE